MPGPAVKHDGMGHETADDASMVNASEAPHAPERPGRPAWDTRLLCSMQSLFSLRVFVGRRARS